MTDIKNVQLLWIKGGLFLLIGCIASGLILLKVQSFVVAVLLAVAVWAFCRAYYFAFYVIEKYADRSFRYAGLVSLVRYCVLGQDRNRQSQEFMTDSGFSEQQVESRPRNVSWLAIKWFAFAMGMNLFAPVVASQTFYDSNKGNQALESTWIGWNCVNVAACVIVAALLNAPLKYRVPISYLALVLLSLALWIGISIPFHFPNDDWVIILTYATSIFTVGTLLLWFYRLRSGYCLEIESSAERTPQLHSNPPDAQVSLRYIFATTIIVALTSSLVPWLVPRGFQFPFAPLHAIVHVFIVGCAMVLLVTLITVVALHFFVSNNGRQRTKLVVLLVAGLLVFPLAIMLFVSALPSPYSSPGATWRDYVGMCVFFASYTSMMFIVLLSFSGRGLRIVRIKN
ncbi:MAG: hypothetical protein ABL921_11290 [Pirellula sp.]